MNLRLSGKRLIQTTLAILALACLVQTTGWAESYTGGKEEKKKDGRKGSGRRSSLPSRLSDSHFAVVQDRWRLQLPAWDRYPREGSLLDPYNQNVLKGDFPVINDDIFFVLTLVSDTKADFTNKEQGQLDDDALTVDEKFFASFELFRGKTVFKPKDWSFKLTSAFDINLQKPNGNSENDELQGDVAVQEAFVEKKLFDVGPYFDSTSFRAGRQAFLSDFRGFIFNDATQGGLLFGNLQSNRIQWNFGTFFQQEKDAVSGFNEFESRNQSVIIANFFYQDLIWEGFLSEVSFHYNRDRKTGNDLDAYLIGFAGDGHIGRYEVAPPFYYAFGEQENNFLAGQNIDISAWLLALEVSLPHDWLEWRASFAYASGDDNPNDGDAEGFDGIFDNPNFAGNGFSFWVANALNVNGLGLVNGNSFYPNLRGKGAQASNYVNPGIVIGNLGLDAKFTPKTIAFFNLNYFAFAETEPVEARFGVNNVGSSIGFEYSAAVQYRPFLNENVIFTVSASALHPGDGLEDLTGNDDMMYSIFVALTLVY